MDGFSSSPVYYTSLETEDFADLSAGEDEEDDDDDEDSSIDVDITDTMEWFIRPRFQRWLTHIPAGHREPLHDLFSRLDVSSREMEDLSAERHLKVKFTLAGMTVHYEQRSHADAGSATWTLSDDDIQHVPNVAAKLDIDGECLIGCKYFVAAAGKSQRWVDEMRLGERFGSETIAHFGGTTVLLGFLGTICADSGASCYAEALPFGLSASVLSIEGPEVHAKAKVKTKKAIAATPVTQAVAPKVAALSQRATTPATQAVAPKVAAPSQRATTPITQAVAPKVAAPSQRAAAAAPVAKAVAQEVASPPQQVTASTATQPMPTQAMPTSVPASAPAVATVPKTGYPTAASPPTLPAAPAPRARSPAPLAASASASKASSSAAVSVANGVQPTSRGSLGSGGGPKAATSVPPPRPTSKQAMPEATGSPKGAGVGSTGSPKARASSSRPTRPPRGSSQRR